jgi:hypothetical protein
VTLKIHCTENEFDITFDEVVEFCEMHYPEATVGTCPDDSGTVVVKGVDSEELCEDLIAMSIIDPGEDDYSVE